MLKNAHLGKFCFTLKKINAIQFIEQTCPFFTFGVTQNVETFKPEMALCTIIKKPITSLIYVVVHKLANPLIFLEHVLNAHDSVLIRSWVVVIIRRLAPDARQFDEIGHIRPVISS